MINIILIVLLALDILYINIVVLVTYFNLKDALLKLEIIEKYVELNCDLISETELGVAYQLSKNGINLHELYKSFVKKIANKIDNEEKSDNE